MIEKTAVADKVVLQLYKEDPALAREYLTEFSVNQAQQLLDNGLHWISI